MTFFVVNLCHEVNEKQSAVLEMNEMNLGNKIIT